jgi:hypothetical protein
LTMTLKEVISQTGRKLLLEKLFNSRRAGNQPVPHIDDGELLNHEGEDRKDTIEESTIIHLPSSLQTTPAESLDKLQKSFERLIEQLAGINEKLGNQAVQHDELLNHVRELPKILEGYPASCDNQKKLTEQLIEQLKGSTIRTEKFIDVIEKIPAETLKQTDHLCGIEHQLAAAADIDVQISESFNNFNRTIDKLNAKTTGQTESIDQMAKTFAASDRYLKYIISRQSRRFMWIFIAAISVCAAVILVLAGIIIYLK